MAVRYLSVAANGTVFQGGSSPAVVGNDGLFHRALTGDTIVVDASGGPMTVTPDRSVGAGTLNVTKVDSTTNSVTVLAGSVSVTLSSVGSSCELTYDGSTWLQSGGSGNGIPQSAVGAPGGVAPLDSGQQVPAENLGNAMASAVALSIALG